MYNDSNNSEKKIDITTYIEDFIKGLKKLWWIILILMVLLSGYSFIKSRFVYTPHYVAYATFSIQSDSNSITAEQLSKTFPYILTSTTLNNLIAEDLGLTYVPGTISADAIENSNIFILKVTGQDPELIYKVLKSTIDNYPKVAEYAIGKTNLQLMDESGIPKEPSGKSYTSYSLSSAKTGAMKGALLGIGIVFIYSITRRTVKRQEDISKLLNIRVLGTIQKVEVKQRRKLDNDIISIANRNLSQGFIESVRSIRTRIEKATSEGSIKTIMITSAMGNEGKSTIAYNLALSLSMKSKRVVLIDCDLKNPSIGKICGLSEGNLGLSEYLSGEIAFNECVQELKPQLLYIIPGGKPVEETTELLTSVRLKKLIDAIKEEMDYVIIDSPPSAILTDAAIIAEHIDAAIYVVKQDYSKASSIVDGLERLSDSGINVLGCIFNGAEGALSSYGGYNRYGSYGRYSSKYYYGEKE